MSFHMRRKDKQITDMEKMKGILESTKFVTIAMCMNNSPYLVTLSYGFDRERNCIYFHCAKEGKKIEFLKVNNKIWGQALNDLGYLSGKCNHLFETVQFSGTVTFLETLEEKREAIKCMIRHLEKNPEQATARIKDERLADTMFGRIDIEFMTGKQPETPKSS
ncbi:MAG TPA: pyridoxamine 5'-phosphate oxidase family protein [Candidatus Acidoferrum sp.]|nr:pyridoxamine 5'-phosphate oxidase family protein [Candidatus Acidoferrum sp.]